MNSNVVKETQEKVCSKCKQNKPLTDFYFHSIHNIYINTCKDCSNLQRRNKYANEKGDNIDKTHCKFRSKTCTICNQTKELNKDNFPKSSHYGKICRDCSGKNKRSPRIKSNRKQIVSKVCYVKSMYRLEDEKKNRIFSLSEDFIKEGLNKLCYYCGSPPTGFDRVNNSIGHTEENCVPCCKECNMARNNNFSHEEMKIIGKVIKKIKRDRILKN